MDSVDRVAETAPEWIRPIRRVEFERMVDVGLFAGERVELLRGCLAEMSPQSAPHAAVLQRLTHLFVELLGRRGAVRVQLPLALLDDSEPEPDLAIVPAGTYDDVHPSRALLVIEVGKTSLGRDPGLKASIYAQAGVPELWIVDLGARMIEVYREPAMGAYQRRTDHVAGDSIRPVEFPDVAVAVRAVLG